MHHVVDVVLIGHKVNAQQASVAVRGVEGLEAVTEVILHRQASQAAAQVLKKRRKRNVLLYFFITKEETKSQVFPVELIRVFNS